MEARSEARAADMIPGIDLENPKSPEALWLAATVLQVTSPSRPTDPPAVTPSSAARMLFSPSLKPTVSPTTSAQHPQPQCSQSPESANATVGKATVWSAPRGDASSIVHTHSSSQTPGKLASVVVYTEPLPQLTQLTLLEQISNKRAVAAAAAQELYLMEAATVAAGLDISMTSDQVAAAAGSPIPPVAAAGIPAQPVAAGVLPAPPVAAAVLPTHPTQTVAAVGSTAAAQYETEGQRPQ
jgi:hypothetical protein